MTNPTLERAARALIQAKHGDADDSYWEMLDGDAKNLARTMVRAVLMAVREPTESMIDAALLEWGENVNPRDIENGFTAMIDAILAEGE